MKALFRALVRLYPREFRRRFGDEVVEQAEAEVARARRRGRLQGTLGLAATAADLVRAGLTERMAPTWTTGSDTTLEREGMGTMTKEWIEELRVAARTLARSPGFLAASAGTLALALGVNAGIFSVVDRVLLDPLPFADPDRLVVIRASAPGSDFPDEFPVAQEFFVQYGEESQQLEGLSTYASFTATLRVGDRVERAPMSGVETSLFDVLGVEPLMGRLPRPGDPDDLMLVSHAAWVDWFGQDPDILGKAYFAMDGPRTIIGIMPPEFRFPSDQTVLWIPRMLGAEDIQPGRFGFDLVGRMSPDADHASLARELTTLSRRLPERFGGSPAYARLIEQHVAVVRPFEDHILGPVAGALWVLMASVALVLLIACANVANLFSVRAEGRGRELAVRRVLGAGRARLVRSLMAEATVVAALAGVVALALAAVAVPALVRLAPSGVPRIADVSLSGGTLAFTLLATAVAALLCGLLPAVRASRPRLQRLRDGTRGSTGRRSWGRDGLVAAQTALALVLLVGSGLLLRSFVALRGVDPGYDTEDVFTFQFAPEQAHLVDGPTWAAFHEAFMDRLRELPEVESVGIVENVPLDEGTAVLRFLPEEAAGDPDGGTRARRTFAGGDYFATMGISVLRGRGFDGRDLETPGHVVVSQSVADRLWPGQDPIGRRLGPAEPGGGTEDWHTVVGVVEDVVQSDLREEADAMVYHPLVGPTPDAWRLSSPGYVIKTPRASTIAPDVRALVREVAPEAPMYRAHTMESLAARAMASLTFTTLTLAIAAGLALVLGAVGLYGVLSYVVTQRRREIGVRMALGAEASRVRRMVVAQGTRVVFLGVAGGVLAALLVTRSLSGLLFGVEALDAGTFVGMSLVMVLVGVVASYLPARRASSVDPIEAMREA